MRVTKLGYPVNVAGDVMACAGDVMACSGDVTGVCGSGVSLPVGGGGHGGAVIAVSAAVLSSGVPGSYPDPLSTVRVIEPLSSGSAPGENAESTVVVADPGEKAAEEGEIVAPSTTSLVQAMFTISCELVSPVRVNRN